MKKKKQQLPPGWTADGIRRLMEHHDNLTEEEQAAEIEAAFDDPGQTMMSVPTDLVSKIAWLIAQHQEKNSNSQARKQKRPRKSTKRGRRRPAQKAAG